MSELINNEMITTTTSGELSFFKVIRNKYLFYKIIGLIKKVVGEALYERSKLDYRNCSVTKRIKFKYIHSLLWMVENNQFQLIKMKLKSNEYIEINNESIKKLFIHMAKMTTTPTTTKITIEEEVLDLLIKNKKEICECIEDNLMTTALEIGNEKVIKILLNNSIAPNLSTRLFIIQKPTIDKIEMMNIIMDSEPYKQLYPDSTPITQQSIQTSTTIQPKTTQPKTKSNYEILIETDTVIERMHDVEEVFYYCEDKLSYNALLYLISKDYKDGMKIEFSHVDYNIETITKNQESILKWIKLATSPQASKIYDWDNTLNINRLLISICKMSIISKEWYCKAIESVDEKYRNQLNFPNWNAYLHLFTYKWYIKETNKVSRVEINNTNIIDWMAGSNGTDNNIIPFLDLVINKITCIIYFTTYQLVDYFMEKCSCLNLKSKFIQSYYNDPYIIAITTCKIQTLIEMDKRIINGTITIEPIYSNDFYKLFLNNSIEQVNQLLEYWSSINYESFHPNTFKRLIQKITYQQRNVHQQDGVVLNLNLNLKNQNFKIVAIKLFIELIKINDFKSISIYLNLFKFQLDNSFFSNFNQLWNEDNQVIRYLFNSSNKVVTNNEIDPIDLFDNIKYWINLGSGGTRNNKFKTISIITNHFYSTLLQIQGITSSQVSNAYQLLIDNGITIEHTIYHTFYYLLIKSPIYIKYLMKKNSHTFKSYDSDDEFDFHDMDGSFDRSENNYQSTLKEIKSISQLLPNLYGICCTTKLNGSLSTIDISQFTFHSLLTTPPKAKDEILLNLINQFTKSNLKIPVIYSYKCFEDIHFLLDINRPDLLIGYIESAKEKGKIDFKKLQSPTIELFFKTLTTRQLMKEIFSKLASTIIIDIGDWFRLCLFNENHRILRYLFKNYPEYITWIVLFDNNSFPGDYNLNTIEYIFSNYGYSFEIQETKRSFRESFLKGNIQFCDKLLKYYPLYNVDDKIPKELDIYATNLKKYHD